ncbi:S41 family peptidase [Parvibaculum sp.]|mgnify:CR=1 FL=1|jgi:carboxyl-terminal processing protease|uniref:S41 family peptidase n=1 Tax=Parvibaculum sp. TaxID=2024848 RepID=UPI000C3E80EE|nr:S41 family peptidase [Parvibaculum sp.]MAM96085.1 peptidase S41 [Parvibaculum sp.]HCX66179.1 peptidase S41 [Rhodobiaceae bacterium]|tara:strand:- start:6518 stop:7849 length:1332 start_codon:yes stop_codon:yes gene_type:complete
MNKSVFAGFAVGTLLSFAAIVGIQQGFLDTPAHASDSNTYRQLNLFGDVFERVRADYVEPTDDAKLVENAINGMLTSLDPHSSYMTPKTFRDMQVQTRGEFGGLGIEVTMENGVVKVVTPIDDTPASRAGLRPNDYITHIDGTQILGLTLSDAVDKMRGAVNTDVVLTVVRKGKDEPFDVKLTRDIITIKSVKYNREGDIGYIRVTSFNEQTADLLEDAIDNLRKQIGASRLKGYIIDLRNNPGGLLDQAIAVSDDFIDGGEIVSTRGRHPEDTQRHNARSGDITDGKPIIVLLNGGSASASEIVAGALQDHRRATILGTRSFGKGSVQTIIPLGSDGALRLTTARYYTPSGRSIQAKGIDPDILVSQTEPEEKKRSTLTGESALPGHLAAEEGDEMAGSDSFVPKDKSEDKQLLYAIDLLNGARKDAAYLGAGRTTASAMAN